MKMNSSRSSPAVLLLSPPLTSSLLVDVRKVPELTLHRGAQRVRQLRPLLRAQHLLVPLHQLQQIRVQRLVANKLPRRDCVHHVNHLVTDGALRVRLHQPDKPRERLLLLLAVAEPAKRAAPRPAQLTKAAGELLGASHGEPPERNRRVFPEGPVDHGHVEHLHERAAQRGNVGRQRLGRERERDFTRGPARVVAHAHVVRLDHLRLEVGGGALENLRQRRRDVLPTPRLGDVPDERERAAADTR